ncbi:MAG: hypothetical protein ABFC57_12820 [Veillonellales bacterium]
MSECKHSCKVCEYAVGYSSAEYCSNCNDFSGFKLNSVIADLRAKLEAAERHIEFHKQRVANLDKYCLEIQQERDEYKTKLETAEKIIKAKDLRVKVNDKTITELIGKISDLQKQVAELEESDRHREFCMVEMAMKIKEYEHEEGSELRHVLKRYKNHRDYVVGLEKQVAGMRKALELAIEFIDIRVLSQREDVQKILVTALDTPSTAYEKRVEGLVAALESISKRVLIPEDNDETVIWVTDKSREALKKWQEGNENG